MTVAEALTETADAPAATAGRNGGRVARLRGRIRAADGQGGQPASSLPPGIFSRRADDPDETDDIRTVDGYVSLAYAAALFGVGRQRLQEAVWRGALPGVKTDESRTAAWMVRLRDVGHFMARNQLVIGRPQGGRPAAGRNLSPAERRFAAATLEIWRQRHAPWMTPEESAALGQRLESEAS